MTNDQESTVIFNGFNENQDLKFFGEYQTTFATFVQGDMNSSYFGLEEDIGGILSCDPVETTISSIGQLSSVQGKKDENIEVWKVFSRQKLDDTIVNNMFSRVSLIIGIDNF